MYTVATGQPQGPPAHGDTKERHVTSLERLARVVQTFKSTPLLFSTSVGVVFACPDLKVDEWSTQQRTVSDLHGLSVFRINAPFLD